MGEGHQYLGTLDGHNTTTDSLAIVGDEVWSGSLGNGAIMRFAFDGSYLGQSTPQVGVGKTALLVVPEPALSGLAIAVALLIRRRKDAAR